MPGDGPPPVWPAGFVETPADVEAALALSTLIWLTPRRRLEIATDHPNAEAMLAAIRDGGAGTTEGDTVHARRADGVAVAAEAAAAGARVVAFGSAEYPEALAQIADPPLVLFVGGPAPPSADRSVAIVGARRCSEFGREMAASLGRGLARAGVNVVSGAARGIDSAAHLGALDGGGTTIAVLGCGIDQSYPSRALIDRIRREGTVLTEFPPGTVPHPRHFPSRNRIVAGLSRATVVVEGAEGSGSMITAEHAMEFGRDVFAVLGAVTNPLAEVPLRLIREGAGALRGVEDLLDDLGLDVDAGPVVPPDLSDDERRALDELHGATLPDRVAAALGITVGDAVAVLTRLELRGLVRSAAGRFEPTLRAISTRS